MPSLRKYAKPRSPGKFLVFMFNSLLLTNLTNQNLEKPRPARSQSPSEQQSRRNLRSRKSPKKLSQTSKKKTTPTATPPASPQAQSPPTQTSQAPSSPTAPTDSKVHQFYTDLTNPLSYSGDANKILAKLESFQYVLCCLLVIF